MKYFIYTILMVYALIFPVKAYSGLRLQTASTLVKPVVTEVKNYNRIKTSAKEYKKATFNLTVSDIYFLERVGLPNIKKMVDSALQTSFELERKDIIKSVFDKEEKKKNSEVVVCIMETNYDDIKNNLKVDIENSRINKDDRYITLLLMQTLEKCANYRFSKDELIQIKRTIEYTIEQDLRSE